MLQSMACKCILQKYVGTGGTASCYYCCALQRLHTRVAPAPARCTAALPLTAQPLPRAYMTVNNMMRVIRFLSGPAPRALAPSLIRAQVGCYGSGPVLETIQVSNSPARPACLPAA